MTFFLKNSFYSKFISDQQYIIYKFQKINFLLKLWFSNFHRIYPRYYGLHRIYNFLNFYVNFYSLWAKNVIFKCFVLLPQNFQIWPKKNLELPGCWEIIYIYDHYWWFYVTWNWFRALISQFFHFRPSKMRCIILSRMSQVFKYRVYKLATHQPTN